MKVGNVEVNAQQILSYLVTEYNTLPGGCEIRVKLEVLRGLQERIQYLEEQNTVLRSANETITEWTYQHLYKEEE